MSSIFCFNESLYDSSRWATRTVSVSAPSGTTTASLPATNIFTRNPAQYFERTGIASGDTVTLDISLTLGASPPPLLGNVSAVVGLLNCHSMRESTGALQDTTVRVRESNTAFTGPYDIDETRTIYLGAFQNAANRQAFMVRTGTSGLVAASTAQFKQQGGNEYRQYVRIEITSASGGAWTLRVGRVVMMSGLVCSIRHTPSRGAADESEVVRAYNGYPYMLAKSPLRGYSGTICALTDRQVHGTFLAEDSVNYFHPSINTISRVTGKFGEVCIIERMTEADSSSIWQSSPVFGLLQEGLVAARIDSTQNGSDGIWESDFDVREIPQF